jgi:hypothetical protein
MPGPKRRLPIQRRLNSAPSVAAFEITSRCRADVARQLEDMAVCPDTKAFFLVLQQRWTERPSTAQWKIGMIDRGGRVSGRPSGINRLP